MKEIKLYLIRHGKTYCNEKQLYCGKSDINLSEDGKEELQEKKKLYYNKEYEYYFSSGAKRANETLDILFPNKPYKIHDELFEYNFGDFELKSYEDLKENHEYLDWINDNEGNVRCPNGETRMEFRNRIKRGFNNLIKLLIEKNITSAVGVTHGGTIGFILEMFYDDSKKFYEYQPKNGEGYEIIIGVNENKTYKIKKIIQIK